MPRANAITRFENMGEVLEKLGGISPRRVRMHPTPGTATEKDLLDVRNHSGVICELVDGILVEKVVGYGEGSLGAWLCYLLQCFLVENDLGNLAGADGFLRLMDRLVRAPDVSFVRWEKLPGRYKPAKPIPDLVPDLAIEILSKGNTRGEMVLKRREYFLSGTELVWMVDPDRFTVTVYTAPDKCTVYTQADTLDGGNVLPGHAAACSANLRAPAHTAQHCGQEKAAEEARQVGPARRIGQAHPLQWVGRAHAPHSADDLSFNGDKFFQYDPPAFSRRINRNDTRSIAQSISKAFAPTRGKE